MATPTRSKQESPKTAPAAPAPPAPDTQIAPVQGKELAQPAFFDPKNIEGMEYMDPGEDIIVPRIKLLQGLSPLVLEGFGKPGEIVNATSRINYGPKIKFVPVLYLGTPRIKWKTREEGGWDCISMDGIQGSQPRTVPGECGTCHDCRFQNFGTHPDPKKKGPACTAYKTYIVLIEGEDFPVALAFERTKIKVAKQFNTMLTYANMPIFHRRYELSSVGEEKHGDKWFNYRVTPAGDTTEEERQSVRVLYEYFKSNKKRVAFDANDGGEEGGGAQSESGEDKAPF